jgi:hypothetical protein
MVIRGAKIMLEVHFIHKDPKKGYEPVALIAVKLPEVPAHSDTITIRGRDYEVETRTWQLDPDSEVQIVLVYLIAL